METLTAIKTVEKLREMSCQGIASPPWREALARFQGRSYPASLHPNIILDDSIAHRAPVSDIPWKGVIFKCLYCGTFTNKFRCDSCGAPIQINHPKARVYANSHNYRFHS